LYRLKAWQTIKISGAVHTVKGMIEFRQGASAWKEYALDDRESERWWLSVERDESVPVCALFREIDAFAPGESVVYEGRSYSRRESGRAEVVDSFGLPDVQIADVVEFEEYRSEDGPLLSREQWTDEVECSAGFEASKDGIVVDDAFAAGENENAAPDGTGPLTFEKMSSLTPGQNLRIRGQNCHVQGYVRYRQDGFTWTEYRIGGHADGGPAWLSVERGPGDACTLSLHRPIPFSQVTRHGENSVMYSGVLYERVEEGRGEVTAHGGDVDFDDGESFTSIEYRSRENATLTCEYWSDEQEASLGEANLGEANLGEASLGEDLAQEDVSLLDSRRRSYGASPLRALFVALLMAGAFYSLAGNTRLFASWRRPPLIREQIASNRSFTHVASVTLQGDRKAQVYSTPLSPDEACRAVIQTDPESVQYVTTTAEDPERGERMLRTTRETVMVYESESGETYVQVSENDEGLYTTYRPRHPVRLSRLYNGSRAWYGSRKTANAGVEGIDTRRYDPVVASARQASITARRSTGGGARFGK
jgi:hypothetical protein